MATVEVVPVAEAVVELSLLYTINSEGILLLELQADEGQAINPVGIEVAMVEQADMVLL